MIRQTNPFFLFAAATALSMGALLSACTKSGGEVPPFSDTASAAQATGDSLRDTSLVRPADGAVPRGDSLRPAERPAADTMWAVRPSSFGPIRFGTSLADASAALGEQIKMTQGLPGSECAYARPDKLPEGTSLMIVSGAVARVNVDTTGILTAAGFGVGSTEDAVQQAYGRQIVTQPHKYTDGHYLIHKVPGVRGQAFGIVFETDGKRVTRYRAGRYPEVEWVEGCS